MYSSRRHPPATRVHASHWGVAISVPLHRRFTICPGGHSEALVHGRHPARTVSKPVVPGQAAGEPR